MVDLDFVRIEFDIATDIPTLLLPELFSCLRSFEMHFKSLSCRAHNMAKCSMSVFCSECPYKIVFGQELSPDPEIIRNHQKPSLPFSLYIDSVDDNILSTTVGLTVIGLAIDYLEIFYSALKLLIVTSAEISLNIRQYKLTVYCLDYHSVRYEISDATSFRESIILLSAQNIVHNSVTSDSIKIILKSPLRLLQNGAIAHYFDFATFFRSQLRRCSSLYSYYGTGRLDLDFVALSMAANNVINLKDGVHFTSLKLTDKLFKNRGLLGTAEYDGLIQEMSSLLILGSYFNAGKSAAFGFGFYKVEVIND
ncbi:MAG: CRISPR system precrRNA processing endoribonuclease RAMP protein Cas6 [Desulfuromonadaceae bacterium]|nr:CRISPR system precrRNA processing endoribonuclease RAMP protein Cas6 [Desulfuromonadaceae bacterium]MDD2856427.1 CRISPR system precrRNA processing endoribonuclease RAMP protein Cas6 [Desulfuromonadaceae bacterium]